ncbi:MAG: cobalt-precorrin-6A reductase [Pseudomonadota bacterium]
MSMRRPVLLLGGTEEARHLQREMLAAGHEVVLSLAGRTRSARQSGARVGGFGGVIPMANAIRRGGFCVLIDATHPFAAIISPNAKRAARMASVPYLRLERPAWTAQEGDHWQNVVSLADAAAAIPPSTRAFLTVGAGGIAPFVQRRDVQFVVRAIEPPHLAGRSDVKVIRARGPFATADERALFQNEAITVLVTKNAGGTATRAKLAAARELGVNVIMIARPPGQPRADAPSVHAMLCLLRQRISLA